jgi:hypothetical protein
MANERYEQQFDDRNHDAWEGRDGDRSGYTQSSQGRGRDDYRSQDHGDRLGPQPGRSGRQGVSGYGDDSARFYGAREGYAASGSNQNPRFRGEDDFGRSGAGYGAGRGTAYDGGRDDRGYDDRGYQNRGYGGRGYDDRGYDDRSYGGRGGYDRAGGYGYGGDDRAGGYPMGGYRRDDRGPGWGGERRQGRDSDRGFMEKAGDEIAS